jgi:LuxR family maltose regulon positive regulatory protein
MLDNLKTLEATWPEGARYAQAFCHRLSLHYLADADCDVDAIVTWLAQAGIAFDALPDVHGVDPTSERYFQTYLCVGHVLAELAQRSPPPDGYRAVQHYFGRQQAFAGTHGLVRRLVELAIVRARLYQAAGEVDKAYAMLQEGLAAAAQKGFFRIFVDEGAPMLALLEGVRARLTPGSLVAYTERLIEAIKRECAAPPTAETVGEGLLSERELEVLRYLAAGLTYPGIAERLIISVNTVRHHVKGMYSKLGVSSRAEALARAREMQLL